MSKRRISHRQRFRIKRLQEQRLLRAEKRLENTEQMLETTLGTEQEGVLITHHGVYVDVESIHGKVFRCTFRQNIDAIVAGDRVIFQPGKGLSGVVVALCPRSTVLGKPTPRQGIKPIAANIDQIIIVIAPEPTPSLMLLDSYLVAAASLRQNVVILLNKTDLLTPENKKKFQQLLTLYGNLGYPVVTANTRKHKGLTQLKNVLSDRVSVFVGQSGVGKSSLLNRLVPKAELKTADLSKISKLGTHTTTRSQLFHLPFGGDLIDSPGIREFGLWHMPWQEICNGFREFKHYSQHCKFHNCTHRKEPECAVLAAVADGHIAKSRLESYYAILVNLGKK